MLQEHIDHSIKLFYKEEKSVPVVLVRTLSPVEELAQKERVDLVITESGSEVRRSVQPVLHGGRRYGKEKKKRQPLKLQDPEKKSPSEEKEKEMKIARTHIFFFFLQIWMS